MENDNEKLNAFGLVGMIVGILTLLISLIPLIGVFAIFLGVIALIFSIIGITKLKKGFAIAGLACSVVGIGISAFQWYAVSKAASEFDNTMDELDNMNYNYDESFDNLDLEDGDL